jgi:hypothetical protein
VGQEAKAFCSSSECFLDVGHHHKFAFDWLALYQTKVCSSETIATEFPLRFLPFLKFVRFWGSPKAPSERC